MNYLMTPECSVALMLAFATCCVLNGVCLLLAGRARFNFAVALLLLSDVLWWAAVAFAVVASGVLVKIGNEVLR